MVKNGTYRSVFRGFRACAATAMAIGAAGVSGEAAAQAAQPGALAAESASTNPGVASDPNTLTEIVVTAQFRSASLQNTPISITAVNAAMMEARNQSSLLD